MSARASKPLGLENVGGAIGFQFALMLFCFFDRGAWERAVLDAPEMVENVFPLVLVISCAAAERGGQKGCHAFGYMTAHSVKDQLCSVAELVTAGAEGSG